LKGKSTWYHPLLKGLIPSYIQFYYLSFDIFRRKNVYKNDNKRKVHFTFLHFSNIPGTKNNSEH
jgi:hypothetical protein